MKIKNRHSFELLEKIYRLFEQMGFSKGSFSMTRNPMLRINGLYFAFDLIVYKNNKIWFVVETKENVIQSSLMRTVVDEFDKRVAELGAEIGLIVDVGRFLIKKYACETKVDGFEEVDEKTLVRVLQEEIERENSLSSVEDELIRNNEIADLLGKIVGSSEFCSKVIFENGMAHFSEEDERKFFKEMLNFEEREVYRYVSFDSLFAMLNGKSYRMCGLAGMNDKTEINYFDPNKTDEVENDIYISSCSTLKDDLTMWRLYGDDAKGVCLVFTLRDEYSKNFDIYKVSYAKDKNEHEKMKLLKALCDMGFVFTYLKKWKHFFKPIEFENEKEIRLLFTDDHLNISLNRNWVKTKNHSIINPIVDFSLTDELFPLRLDEIILGPNFPEKELNENQLREMVASLGLGIRVEKSNIKCYR